MIILRVLGILCTISVIAGIGLYLFTNDIRYLKLSWRIFLFAIVVALIFFGLMALERLTVITPL